MGPDDNPMQHPEEPAAGADGIPHFGRLLVILIIAVAFIGLMTFASTAYFSP